MSKAGSAALAGPSKAIEPANAVIDEAAAAQAARARAVGRWQRAIQAVRERIRNNLEYYAYDGKSNEKLGHRLANEGKHAEAVMRFKRAAKMGQDGGGLWRKLGECLLEMWKAQALELRNKKLLTHASEAYAKALTRIETMTNPHVYAEAAEVYERMADYANALNLLGHVIQTFPNFAQLPRVAVMAAKILTHTGLMERNVEKRHQDLGQALEYLSYIVDDAPGKLGKDPVELRDFQLLCARLYEVVPVLVRNKEEQRAKKRNKYMGKECYKDLFKKMKEDPKVKGDHMKRAYWKSKSWTDWVFQPQTWIELADEYKGRLEYTRAIDCYRMGLARSRIRFGEEAPPDSAWDWASWSYQPYPDVFMHIAWCYRAIRDKKKALEAAEQAQELAPYSIEIRDTLAKWSKKKWTRHRAKQDCAAIELQRIQRGCWGRRRARLRLGELINEAEHRRQTYRLDLSCRPLLQVFKGPSWSPLFAVEVACASRIAAFHRGCHDRAAVREQRYQLARRELNYAIQEWHRDVWNPFARARLAAMSPNKYGKLFALEERSASALRSAWIRLGVQKAAGRRQNKVRAQRAETMHGAARHIQNTWRAYMARRHRYDRRRSKMEQESAALAIQKRIRGFGAKKELRKRKAAEKAVLDERRARVKGAKLIQARWRGHKSRVELAVEQQAAEKVQAIFRGRIGRKLVERRQYKYASTVQAFFQMVHEGYRVAGCLETRIGDDEGVGLGMGMGSSGIGDSTTTGGTEHQQHQHQHQQHRLPPRCRKWRDSVLDLARLMATEAMAVAQAQAKQLAELSAIGLGEGGGAVVVDRVTKGTAGVAWGHCYQMTERDVHKLTGRWRGRGEWEWKGPGFEREGRQTLHTLLGVNSLYADGVGGLDAEAMRAIAVGLTRNRTLHHLLLRDTHIGSEGMLALARALGDNSTLSTLAIGANDIGPDTQECPAIATLASTLRTSNYRLRQLLIEDNPIGDEACMEIGQAVGDFFSAQYCRLQRLVLNRVGMRDRGGRAIGAALNASTSIVSVQLCGNSLRDMAAKSIAEGLKANGTLKELDLSDNMIGSEGGIALAEALGVNQALVTLLLPNNFMREDAWRAFKQALTERDEGEVSMSMSMSMDRSATNMLADQQLQQQGAGGGGGGGGSPLQVLSLEGNLMPTFTHAEVAHFFRKRRRRRGKLRPVVGPAAAAGGGSRRAVTSLMGGSMGMNMGMGGGGVGGGRQGRGAARGTLHGIGVGAPLR